MRHLARLVFNLFFVIGLLVSAGTAASAARRGAAPKGDPNGPASRQIANRPLGDSRVFAHVPASPGFPEGIAVQGDRVYVCGPSVLGNTDPSRPSKVLAYDLDSGALVQEYLIHGQNLNQPHGLVGCTFRERGVLYIVDMQQGIIRLNVFSADGQGTQTVFAAPVPDLPMCAAVPAGTPCSPTATDRPPLANDLTFDADGVGFLTDTFQATIWRIPPGGGQPQIWFQDPRLDTDAGPNGVRINPQDGKLYFAVSLNAQGHGFIYTLPLERKPRASDLVLFHEYLSEAPDGIAFGRSGQLYVALTLPSQISVLRPDGTEAARYLGPAADSQNPTQPLPWTNPANIAFNDKTGALLVTNRAGFVANPDPFFAVFDVFVRDKAI